MGHFPSKDEAEKAMGELEQYFMLELGYTHVRGGITQEERALCGCEEPDDCDKRVGCYFTSYAHDDAQYDAEEEEDDDDAD